MALLSVVVVCFVIYEAWPNPEADPSTLQTAAKAANPGGVPSTPLTPSQIADIVTPLSSAYGSTGVTVGTFTSGAQIVAPLQNASISVHTQQDWANVLAQYKLQNPNHDLITDVTAQLNNSIFTGLFSSDLSAIGAVQAYIQTLPVGS